MPQLTLPGMQEIFFDKARESHYEQIPSAVRSTYEQADAFITVAAPQNTRALAGVDPEKQQALGRRNQPL